MQTILSSNHTRNLVERLLMTNEEDTTRNDDDEERRTSGGDRRARACPVYGDEDGHH